MMLYAWRSPDVTQINTEGFIMSSRPQNAGELGRVVSHDASDEWPMAIEIVAYWKGKNGKKGRRRSFEIPADRFFGTGSFGAPMGGAELITMIERLRRQGPSKAER